MKYRRALLLLALAIGFVSGLQTAAQCQGSAVALTAETRTFGCDVLAGIAPRLSWTFRLDCYDGCGDRWSQLPVSDATATGACAMIPPTTCNPEFAQYNHVNGLYGVSSAFDQTIFAGCRLDDHAQVTQANCPCAPACDDPFDDSPPPSDGGDQEGGPGELPGSGPPDLSTPVIVSLGDGRYELTSAADGVAFDLDADGHAERIAWTVAGGDDAFLALDRDGNGRIDDGRELFGDESPQLPSAEPNGFRALAVFDDPLNGGDGDGWIDRRDSIFEHLLLWRDADHDGVTDDRELQTLGEGGIEALAVGYRTVHRRDEHGNVYRYRAEAIRSPGPGARVAWDVLLTEATP